MNRQPTGNVTPATRSAAAEPSDAEIRARAARISELKACAEALLARGTSFTFSGRPVWHRTQAAILEANAERRPNDWETPPGWKRIGFGFDGAGNPVDPAKAAKWADPKVCAQAILSRDSSGPYQPPIPSVATPAKTADALERKWNPDLHPRGGYPQNRGWFSRLGSRGGLFGRRGRAATAPQQPMASRAKLPPHAQNRPGNQLGHSATTGRRRCGGGRIRRATGQHRPQNLIGEPHGRGGPDEFYSRPPASDPRDRRQEVRLFSA